MTVGKAGARRPVATGCGAAPAKPTTPKKPAARPAVSSGCGSSSSGGGWKAKTVTTGGKSGKTTGLSERAKTQLEKAKTPKGRTAVSTGCGAAPAKPHKPTTPSAPPKPVRSGC